MPLSLYWFSFSLSLLLLQACFRWFWCHWCRYFRCFLWYFFRFHAFYMITPAIRHFRHCHIFFDYFRFAYCSLLPFSMISSILMLPLCRYYDMLLIFSVRRYADFHFLPLSLFLLLFSLLLLTIDFSTLPPRFSADVDFYDIFSLASLPLYATAMMLLRCFFRFRAFAIIVAS